MPAAGAGPLGPFITVPIPEGGGSVAMGGPSMGPPSGGGRGPGRGGRGPPRGGPMMRGRGYGGGPPGYGGPIGGPPQRGYYDLDAPENQRSVLDYGDL